MHKCIRAHMHKCTCQTYYNKKVSTCILAYMHTCMHACMRACIHAYMSTCIHAHMHTCMHTHIHTCKHALFKPIVVRKVSTQLPLLWLNQAIISLLAEARRMTIPDSWRLVQVCTPSGLCCTWPIWSGRMVFCSREGFFKKIAQPPP